MLAVLWWLAPLPALGFELFGVHLFGERSVEDEIVDPVPYSVALVVNSDDAALIDAIEESSLLIGREDIPPSGTVGLLARARDDRERLIAALYEAARYGGTVNIEVAGRPLQEISVTETLAPKGETVPVRITVDPGPVFVFGTIAVEGVEPTVDAVAVAAGAGLATGVPAYASTVAAAEAALVLASQSRGHPFAAVTDRSLIADHARQALDVRFTLSPGPVARFGRVRVVGNEDVEAPFLARHADIPWGALYHPQVLERARDRLVRLEALGSVLVRTAEALDPDGTVPVIIEVSERKKRTIGAGATFSSTEGAGVEAFWMHRNLFGEAETLRLEGAVERLLEADEFDEHDFRFAVAFSKPGFLDPLMTLDMRTGLLQEDPNPYHRVAAFHESLLSYEITEDLTLRGGFEIDASRIDDAFGRNRFTLVGLPLIADYDSRDSLLDPTRGVLARLTAEPFFDLEGRPPFFKTDGELRLYYRAGSPRLVLALRGRAGTIVGSDLAQVPAHRRFYAGGGGSVRGYDFLNIGPRLPGFGATGGLARVEGSAEARFRITDSWGIVPFIDAGYVTAEPDFTSLDDVRVGIGVGLRYYTAVGPLRLDVAVPLDPHGNDPDFAVYVGIGQAF